MSVNRLLLRLAATAAASNFWEPPFPTLANNLVFDSKIEPIENFKPDEAYPTIVVYTDYDKNFAAHQDISHYDRTMTITFELLMAVMTPINTENLDEGYILNQPQTDAELEASLDVLEWQLFESLRANNSAANCFRTLVYGIDNVVSRRGATTEGGTKIAARQITYEGRVIQELSLPMLPAYATEFLNELESKPEGVPHVAQQLRALYMMGNNADGLERLRRTMGWTAETFEKLGYPQPGAPILGTPVVWLNQNGLPLN